MVLTVSTNEVLVITNLTHILLEEECLYVVQVEHDELRNESWVERSIFDEGLLDPILIEKREFLIVEFVNSSQFNRSALVINLSRYVNLEGMVSENLTCCFGPLSMVGVSLSL